MFARLHVIFQTCMKQLYFLRFFVCMCFIPTETQTNKQTAVDVKHWKRNTAVDVTLTAFRCTSFRSACCFCFVCRRMQNANRQTAVDVTGTNAKLQFT